MDLKSNLFGMLAHHWKPSSHFGAYYVSRKLNGVSMLWDGGLYRGVHLSKVPFYRGDDTGYATGFWSLGRSAGPQVINVPDHIAERFTVGIPQHGELWAGDELMNKVSGLSRAKYLTNEHLSLWEKVKFMVFNVKPYYLWVDINSPRFKNFINDNPIAKDFRYSKTFQEYYAALNNYLPLNDTVQLVEQTPVLVYAAKDLKEWTDRMRKEKWEGLMLLKPSGTYRLIRSEELLKVKTFFEDTAEVVAYNVSDSETYRGDTASLRVRYTWDEKVTTMKGGREEFVGRTVEFNVTVGKKKHKKNAEKYFPIGSKVKFKFFYISGNGVPESPSVFED